MSEVASSNLLLLHNLKYIILLMCIGLRQIREVYHESGIRGFWKGLVPTLIMVSYLLLKYTIKVYGLCMQVKTFETFKMAGM